jgi:hypothetical protein
MTLLARETLSQRLRGGGMRVLFGLFIAGMVVLAVGAVVYLLQPHWSDPPVPSEAPPLPVVVAGVVFNVPPAAIRVALQRRAGPQERIDLAYRWPELTPPDSHAPGVAGTPARLFVTIETAQSTLPPAERLRTIYPRYIDTPSTEDPGGLTVASFADGTPYQGEDVMYDAAAPERFLVRCNRARGDLTLAMCLYERPVGAAALTFRFPRDLIADWRAVQNGIDRLIERWQPAGR